MALRRQGLLDVLARAGAGVGAAFADESVECGLVERTAPRLPYRRLVGHQAAGGELAKDFFGRAGHAARRVHILDPHQPTPAVGAGIEPAGQGRDQRARMQRPGGRGREPAE